MDILDSIKESIDSNQDIDESIKEKLFDLIIIFHNKFSDIKLDRFSELVKTVKLGRIGKYESLGTSFYNVKDNEILLSPNRIKNIDYDLDNLFMRIVLSMITSNGAYSGFNSDKDLRALNSAYEEILANYLIGSSEVSDQEEEMVITNIIGNIIGVDKLFEAYFSNNGKMISDALEQIENDCKLLKIFEHFASAKLHGFIIPNEYADNIKYTVDLTSKALNKGLINLDNLEMIYELCPDSGLGYNNMNHHGLDVPKDMCKSLLNQYSENNKSLIGVQSLVRQK